MNYFEFSSSSKEKMEDLHPDMVKILNRALQLSRYDFGVSETLRAFERQKEMVASGRSMTLNSEHLAKDDGFSYAVDIYGYYDGRANYTDKVMNHISKCMYQAAFELCTAIEWGGLWTTLVDKPHYQLMPEW